MLSNSSWAATHCTKYLMTDEHVRGIWPPYEAFYIEAMLLWKFGPPIRDFIEKRLVLVVSVFAVALVGGFLALELFL